MWFDLFTLAAGEARRRDLLEEAERHRLIQQARSTKPRRLNRILAGLGRLLVAIGEKLQGQNAPADSLIIPLPYGRRVDWCRNVSAAGECTVVWQGKAHRAGEPEVIDEAAGLPAFSSLVQNLIRRNTRRTGNDQFLRLKRLAEQDAAKYQRITAEHPGDKPLKVVGAGILLVLAARGLSRLVKKT